jgi:hypothetical protein
MSSCAAFYCMYFLEVSYAFGTLASLPTGIEHH